MGTSKDNEAAIYKQSRSYIQPVKRTESPTSFAPPTYEQAIQQPLEVSQTTPRNITPMSITTINTFNSTTSSNSISKSTPTDDDILNQALAFTRNPAPPASSIRPLALPIAIPQSAPGLTASYTRLFAPSLPFTHGITPEDFLAFIDNLNLVVTPTPPLQVVDAVGGIISFIPSHIFTAIGTGIQAGAKLGGVALSAGRVKIYMQRANEEFFWPRRLRVRIVDAEELAQVLRLPGSVPGVERLTQETMWCSSMERRMQAVRGYVTETTFDVTPPVKQTDVLKRICAKQVELSEDHSERKTMKRREKMVRKEMRGKGGRREDKESKAARKVKWLLIENL